MNPYHPFFCVIIYSIAFLSAYLIQLKFKSSTIQSRYETVDGLRGFLALGVFIHHSSVWYIYLQNGSWAAPTSNLYQQFGQASVILFFMITSFLFITKLLKNKKDGINWKEFYISRIFRIAPMYFISLLIIVVVVMILSSWKINTSPYILFKSIANWVLFTIYNTPNINDNSQTVIINAGIAWTLPYEWFFYFSLPLISLVITKPKPSVYMVLFSAAFIILFLVLQNYFERPYLYLAFIGGGLAAWAVNENIVPQILKNHLGSFIIILCFIAVIQFDVSENISCILLLSVIITLVASGNTVWGVFNNRLAKLLGEMSYSTYLLHGITLFVLFNWGIGLENAKRLSPEEFSIYIFCLTPVVVLLSFMGFKLVEKPFMDKAKIKALSSLKFKMVRSSVLSLYIKK